jgi:hypothetical protein
MEKNTMKSNLVIALFSVAMLATSGYSQTSGGTGTTAPPSPTGPTSPGAAGTPPPTLNPGIGENSFQARPRTQNATPPGQVLPGQIGITNTVVTETNQFVSTNVTPTSQPGFTNRIMATNGAALMRDQAISETDRRLLGQIHTAVFGSTQVGGTSIHFILRDGAVRIVGFVPNADEQKRIVDTVQGVPGVVRVYDALQIGGSAAPGQTAPAQTPAPVETTVPTQTPAPAQPTPGQPQ